MSDKHKDIYGALLSAQPNFGTPEKDAENTHFGQRYATLKSVVTAVKAPLNEEGIVFFHRMHASELGEVMVTHLHHSESGTSLEFPVPLLLSKRDMQGLKSAQTYAKRIGLEDATGVASGDEDDDAETVRKAPATMGAAIKEAWTQSVLDSIPENASALQKATAFADAICADFEGKKEKALQNRLGKHKGLIAEMEGRFPDLHAKVIDAFEIAMMKAQGNYESSNPMAAE